MTLSARPWRVAVVPAFTSLVLGGTLALADAPPPLSQQLTDLGRQALAQGQKADAAGFFRKALELDPGNQAARAGLNDQALVRVALQDTAEIPPAPEPAPEAESPSTPPTAATLEQAAEVERVLTQQLTTDIRERQQRARDLVNSGNSDSAINLLRLGQQAIRSSESVPQAVRDQLDREVQVQIQTTVRRAEQLDMERVEEMRIQAAEAQRARTLADQATDRETVNALMTQFDMLMAKGQYNVMFNGGLGDINLATAPFYDARSGGTALTSDGPAGVRATSGRERFAV